MPATVWASGVRVKFERFRDRSLRLRDRLFGRHVREGWDRRVGLSYADVSQGEIRIKFYGLLEDSMLRSMSAFVRFEK